MRSGRQCRRQFAHYSARFVQESRIPRAQNRTINDSFHLDSVARELVDICRESNLIVGATPRASLFEPQLPSPADIREGRCCRQDATPGARRALLLPDGQMECPYRYRLIPLICPVVRTPFCRTRPRRSVEASKMVSSKMTTPFVPGPLRRRQPRAV
jgi:hypothetical protein